MEQEGPPRQTTLFACGVTSGKATSCTSIRKNRTTKSSTTKPSRAPASNENLDDQPKPSGSKKNKIFDREELKKSDNLITTSTAYDRAFHYVTGASGHQQSNGRSSTVLSSWSKHRNAKLAFQAPAASANIFKGVCCYLSGYQGDEVGNLEMERLIFEHGGSTIHAFSRTRITHIVSSSGLSGKKLQDQIKCRKSATRIVRPEWVLDSIYAGARRPESDYSVLELETQPALKQVLPQASSNRDQEKRAKDEKSRLQAEDDLRWFKESRAKEEEHRSIYDLPPSAQRC